jgi:hypothetical protein
MPWNALFGHGPFALYSTFDSTRWRLLSSTLFDSCFALLLVAFINSMRSLITQIKTHFLSHSPLLLEVCKRNLSLKK